MIDVIDITSSLRTGNLVLEGAIDSPKGGHRLDGYGVEIEGWVVGLREPVQRIEILHRERVLRTVTPKVPRPDIASVYPDAPGAELAGFRTLLTLVGLPETIVVRVVAVLHHRRQELAQLAIRRRRLTTSDEPCLHPIIVSTMGRTGSVWLSQLLGEHPQVVTYRPFQSEPRVGSYWMHVLAALTDPRSMLQALAPHNMDDNWWLGTAELASNEDSLDPTIARWLLSTNIEALARFCLSNISAFYTEVARTQKKDGVVYFGEKYETRLVPALISELDPHAREIFLVRDPRDQLASLAAWTSRGRGHFGIETDRMDTYLRWLAPRTKELLEHWRARASRSALLRYEDLVLNPEVTLASVFSHLGIAADPQLVVGILASAAGKMQESQREHQTSRSPAASVGRWREEIDPSLWPTMQKLFAEELEAWYPDSV